MDNKSVFLKDGKPFAYNDKFSSDSDEETLSTVELPVVIPNYVMPDFEWRMHEYQCHYLVHCDMTHLHHVYHCPECDKCDKTYTPKSSLCQHRHMIHEGRRNHNCYVSKKDVYAKQQYGKTYCHNPFCHSKPIGICVFYLVKYLLSFALIWLFLKRLLQ